MGILLKRAILACALALTGCATQAPPVALTGRPYGEAAEVQRCTGFFYLLDRAVTEAGVRDGGAAMIAGYPYFRVNRFLASLSTRIPSNGEGDEEFAAWVDRLLHLAETGWRLELANLLQMQRNELKAHLPKDMEDDLAGTVGRCAGVLRNRDLQGPGDRRALIERARVPPDYITWQRVVGLYLFTALPFAQGVYRWQRTTWETFWQPLQSLPVQGELIRFVPPDESAPTGRAQIEAILMRSSRNPLHIPEPQGEDRDRLFAAFAPTWEVDVATADDCIGSPEWQGGGIYVEVARPTVYRYISHMPLNGKVLLQLNYVVWFPSRPKDSALDLLGGRLDGITWRVTLAPDGMPLVYDAIHNCGCYHLFFPTSRLHPKPQANTLEEKAFVPQQAPSPTMGSGPYGLTLRVASGTHYLQRLLSEPSPMAKARTYRWTDYDELRSLPLPAGGRRSLFRPDGIVPGTERGERWLFWPMGVPDPGAMRQLGRHATAFIGRRHFDDPDLIERYFVWAD